MADTKITALTALTAADPANDVIPIVDISDTSMAASGTTKKISVNNILGASGTATLASATITGDLTVDTSTLKVDATNNRVGILTASPAYALDVAGAGNFQQLRVSNSGATNIGLVNTTSGLTYSLYSANSASNGFDGFGILDGTSYVLRINTNGALVLTGGTVGASGVGIAFPATQVASSDANTLDDYEEGTWTPTIKGTSTAGTGTYSVQVGTYTKVGRVVYFQGRLTWSAHTGTGDMQIAGIPFTSLSTTNSNSPCNFGYVNNLSLAASSVLTGFVFPNTNDIGLYQYTAGGGVASTVAIDTAADIIFSGFYFV